jgi:hypothetical protein
MIADLPNIATLIDCGGQITLGRIEPIRHTVATATDEAQCLAMLVQRDGETLDELVRRLDAAILDAYENERFTDEINVPRAAATSSPRRRKRVK